MTVELICVGTELLLGNIVNTNAAWLAEQCAALGLSCYYQTVVGDNADRLAGILETGLKPIDRFLDEDLDRIVETNQKGTMRCMRAAARRMQSGASIVNVASVAGVKGCGGAAYVASKAAVIGVTKHTALRFQQTGIRCNAICPGNIITPMTTGTDPAMLDPDMIGAMAAHSNLKTPSCTAEDVANVILFFASDESRAITGQVIVTDFGAML